MKILLKIDPHPHHIPRLLKGKKEHTQTTEGLGTYLLKSLSDFLADLLTQELQDSYMPRDCRLTILRLVVHTGYAHPEDNVLNIYIYTKTPLLHKAQSCPLLCISKITSLFSQRRKNPQKEQLVSLFIYYSVLMLG